MATKALAYLRTSSAANVDGDSAPRQRAAIARYAAANGIEVVDEFNDAAVSGTDAIEDRPGFLAMLARIDGNGVRLVLVEDASRFARDLLVQELGIREMVARGVRVVTAGGEDLTDSTDPSRVMIRQILGAVSQNEKARLVAKLKAARDRASAARGARVEGRTGYKAKDKRAVYDTLARLVAADPNASLAALSGKLAEAGFMNGKGKPLGTGQVARLKIDLIKLKAKPAATAA